MVLDTLLMMLPSVSVPSTSPRPAPRPAPVCLPDVVPQTSQRSVNNGCVASISSSFSPYSETATLPSSTGFNAPDTHIGAGSLDPPHVVCIANRTFLSIVLSASIKGRQCHFGYINETLAYVARTYLLVLHVRLRG